ncbi:MAG: exonuclease domain-containing protein [Pelagibacteraceae bacterium]|jgi:exodeoxyribonuclease-1|nr:exonuclease domain-containing protein [Pelagibacteraceae bacterium]MDP6710145.1 exonuclease domain-containing protein [Pelagibacteraceae bacterium]|tara:strand:- start:2075 stop:3490 length:1416 start_codon:yes stop_codon:yes gene_type:complete
MPNYVFYDFETCSSNVSYGQIIEAAAVLVNDDFQELDRYEGRCRLNPGIIPEAMALIVNKSSVAMLKNTNLSHYQMIKQLMEKFNRWKNSVFFGYNSIDFDEEFLRRTLFKNLEYPYITVTNGNERGDLLGLARAAHLYYPDCIKTPISSKNNPLFKLDQLAPMNNIKHDKAHSAMGDVLATVEIAKLLSKKAPNVWKASLITTNKDKCLQIIKDEELFCTNFFYGKATPFVLTYVCQHPWNYAFCFDLKADPSYYFKLSVQELKKEIFDTKPRVMRTIKHKKHPIIMNAGYGINFDSYKQLGLPKLRERAKMIRENKDFARKVNSILEEDIREKQELDSQLDVYAEESIYKKFPTNEDSAIMPEFHKVDWKDKFSILQKFKDERFQYFGKRILYEESPESLPKKEYNIIHKEIASRVLSTNNEKWNTIPRTYSEIDTLRNKFKEDKEKLKALEDINSYVEEMEKIYQKAS